MAAPVITDHQQQSRRRRILFENLTAYAFLAPALILLFVFGIYPVGFAFFVSLHRWRRFPGDYLGLSNYVQALDHLAYVLFFWMALALLFVAGRLLWRLWSQATERLPALSAIIPGIVNGAAVILLLNWVTILLPIILNIPQRIRGQERVPGLFMQQLVASFQFPEAVAAGSPFLLVAVIAIIVTFLWLRVVRSENRFNYLLWASGAAVAAAISFFTFQLTFTEVQTTIAEAQANGEALPIWSQVIFITLGVVALVAAYIVWQRALKQDSDRRFVAWVGVGLLLIIGGYLLVVQIPQALTNADPQVLRGLGITVLFALGTVPFQLAIGLGLAYLLFQNIRGKSFFRIVYFMPYIMPFVATSIVFQLIFSYRPTSIANHVLELFGIGAQKWLLEPTGILRLAFGSSVPEILAGPSLALIVIMLYTTWTYIGYDAVVFLAGLGNVAPELYEVARIDGASNWKMFRHITLPLLSPTTFFLSLIAIIGTFQAFTQIWIMRTPAAQSSVDTLGVYIFRVVQNTDPNMGYGSAVAFVLFGIILLLTIFQNRIMGSRVFYG
ncbi:MAG: ABC transporter permease subunit [Chloroflexi bacterium]|nr:ABC transporter permease subunit [Chloroflexota bacterium]MCC6892962.1 sugar ABC transporter permease [Anaerolineae bacterium]